MTLLGGRVHYRQPDTGYRTGIEPVLLAASIPARAGERVLEGGTGAGAGLLCLLARVPGVEGLAVEIDPALANMARANAAANEMAIEVVTGDLCAIRLDAADHAFANPPWHDPASTPSPDPQRALARRTAPGLLEAWVQALTAPLRHRGTLTLLVPAAQFGRAATAMRAARLGALTLQPFWPKPAIQAKLLILQGIKGGRGADRVMPGLVLHEADGSFTPAAEAILRHGAAL